MMKRNPPRRGPSALVSDWAMEYVKRDSESKVKTSYAYGAFLDWLKQQEDNRFVDAREFTRLMGSRYTPPVESDDGWFYEGIQLRPASR